MKNEVSFAGTEMRCFNFGPTANRTSSSLSANLNRRCVRGNECCIPFSMFLKRRRTAGLVSPGANGFCPCSARGFSLFCVRQNTNSSMYDVRFAVPVLRGGDVTMAGSVISRSPGSSVSILNGPSFGFRVLGRNDARPFVTRNAACGVLSDGTRGVKANIAGTGNMFALGTKRATMFPSVRRGTNECCIHRLLSAAMFRRCKAVAISNSSAAASRGVPSIMVKDSAFGNMDDTMGSVDSNGATFGFAGVVSVCRCNTLSVGGGCGRCRDADRTGPLALGVSFNNRPVPIKATCALVGPSNAAGTGSIARANGVAFGSTRRIGFAGVLTKAIIAMGRSDDSTTKCSMCCSVGSKGVARLRSANNRGCVRVLIPSNRRTGLSIAGREVNGGVGVPVDGGVLCPSNDRRTCAFIVRKVRNLAGLRAGNFHGRVGIAMGSARGSFGFALGCPPKAGTNSCCCVVCRGSSGGGGNVSLTECVTGIAMAISKKAADTRVANLCGRGNAGISALSFAGQIMQDLAMDGAIEQVRTSAIFSFVVRTSLRGGNLGNAFYARGNRRIVFAGKVTGVSLTSKRAIAVYNLPCNAI